MGMAEIAEALWNHHLRHNPTNPHGRIAIVSLSNGHGSMLIYALLHLTGYDLPMEEIKRFRQSHFKTPVIRSTVIPWVLKRQQALWVKASLTPLVWRWQKNYWLTNSISQAMTSSMTTHMYS